MTTRFAKARKRREPAFLATARAFYGDAFGARRRKDLAAAIEDWTELPEDEQSFAQAHLAWLNLQAHARTQRLLAQVRDLLEEMVEAMNEALEEPAPAEEDGFAGADPFDDDVTFPDPDEEPDLDGAAPAPGEDEDDADSPEDLDEAGDAPEPTLGGEGS